jgi:KaiC/GvpD/RAD55 family RecA-like ATPase
MRHRKDGHLSTIVGRGGSGKSILALQLVTALLERSVSLAQEGSEPKNCAAFYFTLEASPEELKRQVTQFEWGRKRYEEWTKRETHLHSNGLFLVSVPSPAESLNTLALQIRQTVARQMQHVDSLAAIVIDPMGAINADRDLRHDLSQLKELAETHRTFVFLLSEKHAFERHPSIEHYSQSIIHLEHDPGQPQHRRLHLQKARGQSFRSGYHHFELQPPSREGRASNQATSGAHTDTSPVTGTDGSGLPSKGIWVYPSMQAQAAYAHEILSENQPPRGVATPPGESFFPINDETDERFPGGEEIEVGSAVFLMGPPGTFKEYIASQFAFAARATRGATIYVSFKADIDSIHQKGAVPIRPQENLGMLAEKTYFLDARNPLLTPEEILFTVHNALIENTDPDRGNSNPTSDRVVFQRAIVWGLRRLRDFPYFKEGRDVQFLEALVTLLKAQRITSLLVDWPDKQTPSTVPIADLCQYVFLTRVCSSPHSKAIEDPDIKTRLQRLWDSDRDTKQIAFLRAQRTRRGVHHDQGAIIKQVETNRIVRVPGTLRNEPFEHSWLYYGVEWEQDLSLLS